MNPIEEHRLRAASQALARRVGREAGAMAVVYRERVRCPHCGSLDVMFNGTPGDQGDGSILRYMKCPCGESFKYVEEP